MTDNNTKFRFATRVDSDLSFCLPVGDNWQLGFSDEPFSRRR